RHPRGDAHYRRRGDRCVDHRRQGTHHQPHAQPRSLRAGHHAVGRDIDQRRPGSTGLRLVLVSGDSTGNPADVRGDVRRVRIQLHHQHGERQCLRHVSEGGVMATYRVLAIIPTAADMPDGSGIARATDNEIVRALNAVVEFPEHMANHSAGMCEIDLSIRVYDDVLPASVFTERNGQDMIQPNRAAIETGDRGYYDAHVLYNPAAMTTATTFRGLGGATSGVPYCWIKIGSDELAITIHEWG